MHNIGAEVAKPTARRGAGVVAAEPRHGMASFPQVLDEVRAAWEGRRDEVAEVAAKIVKDLGERTLTYGDAQPPSRATPWTGNGLFRTLEK